MSVDALCSILSHSTCQCCLLALMHAESRFFHWSVTFIHYAVAMAQCIVISPVCGFVCLWVCYHDNSKLHASIFTKLQLIKFWPSCASEKGVCSGAKIFGSALLQPTHSVCVSLGAFFIDNVCLKSAQSFTSHCFS